MSRVLMTIVKTFTYGSNRVMLLYATALKQAGHDVSVAYEFAPESDGARAESILPQIEAEGISTFHVPRLSSAALPFGTTELATQVQQRGFDVLISNQLRDAPATMAVARKLGLPGVVLAQVCPMFFDSSLSHVVKRWLYRRAINRHAQRVIGVSPAVIGTLMDRLGLDPSKGVVVLNGLDLNSLPPGEPDARASVREEFRIADDELVLLTIGRFHPQKGLDILIKTMRDVVQRDVPPLRLLIAAEENSPQTLTYRKMLESLVREYGLTSQISFIGFRKDCHRLLQGADVFVLPSRAEGFPLVVLEAFAAECPVIQTEFGRRLPNFHDGVEGLEIPLEDIPALTEAITKMVSWPQSQRIEMGRAGRAYLDRHPTPMQSAEQFVEEIEQVLTATTAGRTPRQRLASSTIQQRTPSTP